jgi:hypothetical protein
MDRPVNKPIQRPPRSQLPPKRRDRLASPKAMTLIAGLRCIDGFLVAADTAVSVGDFMFHGQKIDHYVGKQYQMVIACSGTLSCAQTAARQIHEKLLLADDLDATQIIGLVEAELIDVHEKHVFPFLNVKAPAPFFNLIIGIECRGVPQVLHTDEMRVTRQRPYVFDGAGHDLANTYAESLLRNRQDDDLPIYTASALHIVDEIFRTVKRFTAGVGLDTRIYAWRTEGSKTPFFELGKNEQDTFWLIQERLKAAFWSALEFDSEAYFNDVKNIPTLPLEKLHNAAKNAMKHEYRFVSYSSMPRGNESRIRPLDRWESGA